MASKIAQQVDSMDICQKLLVWTHYNAAQFSLKYSFVAEWEIPFVKPEQSKLNKPFLKLWEKGEYYQDFESFISNNGPSGIYGWYERFDQEIKELAAKYGI